MKSSAKRAKRPFFMVPSEVYNYGLSQKAVSVYIFLCKAADNEDGTSFPGKKEIAARCDICATSVYYAIKELVSVGLIRVEPRFEDGHQKSNLYTVYDAPGEAFARTLENTATAGQTNVLPHSPHEPLPIQDMNPYPFTGRTPTHSPDECGTKPNELDSFNYGGGGAAQEAPKKRAYGSEFKKVMLHIEERDGLVKIFGEKETADCIARLDAYIESTGKQYRNHYATLYNWLSRDTRKAATSPIATPKPNRFINFKQRDIDFDQYEKLERLRLEKELADEPGPPRV